MNERLQAENITARAGTARRIREFQETYFTDPPMVTSEGQPTVEAIVRARDYLAAHNAPNYRDFLEERLLQDHMRQRANNRPMNAFQQACPDSMNENGFGRRFKDEWGAPFTFSYSLSQGGRPRAIVAEIQSYYGNRTPQVSGNQMKVYFRVTWKYEGESAHAGVNELWHLDASPEEPCLTVEDGCVVPFAANDMVAITYGGKEQLWPRWMVETAIKVTEPEFAIEANATFEYQGDTYTMAWLRPESAVAYTPLAFLVEPDAKMAAFAAGYGLTRARAELVRRLRDSRREGAERLRARQETAITEYRWLGQQLAMAQRGEASYVETLFAEMERLIKEDSQVLAAWIDREADVNALIGPITTQNGVDFGHFRLNLTERRAWPVSRVFSSYYHANIDTSDNHFCMGGQGTQDYSDLVAAGRYADAAAYFIYRLSKPGGDGYRPHNPRYVPPLARSSKLEVLHLMDMARTHAGCVWGVAKPSEAIDRYFSGAEREPQRRAQLPLRTELYTIEVNELHDRVEGSSADIDLDDYSNVQLAAHAWSANLLTDVWQVVDEDDGDRVVWQRPERTYRNRVVRPRDSRGRFVGATPDASAAAASGNEPRTAYPTAETDLWQMVVAVRPDMGSAYTDPALQDRIIWWLRQSLEDITSETISSAHVNPNVIREWAAARGHLFDEFGHLRTEPMAPVVLTDENRRAIGVAIDEDLRLAETLTETEITF